MRAKARVALLKGLLILGAAIAVAVQIGWRLTHPAVPLFEGMGIAGALNLAANGSGEPADQHRKQRPQEEEQEGAAEQHRNEIAPGNHPGGFERGKARTHRGGIAHARGS